MTSKGLFLREGAKNETMSYASLELTGRVAVVVGGRASYRSPAPQAASFVSGEILVVDGGFLASGVNQ